MPSVEAMSRRAMAKGGQFTSAAHMIQAGAARFTIELDRNAWDDASGRDVVECDFQINETPGGWRSIRKFTAGGGQKTHYITGEPSNISSISFPYRVPPGTLVRVRIDPKEGIDTAARITWE